MRQIKFRVWDKVENKMIVDPQSYHCLHISDMFNNPTSNWTWMQFTGLVDGNGKEIYEGDIITFDEQHIIDGRDTHLRLIHWRDDAGRFDWVQPETKESLSGWTFCENNAKLYAEIIGNIHENPELLVVKK